MRGCGWGIPPPPFVCMCLGMVKGEGGQNRNLRGLLHKVIIRRPKLNNRKSLCVLYLLFYLCIYF